MREIAAEDEASVREVLPSARAFLENVLAKISSWAVAAENGSEKQILEEVMDYRT